MMREREVARSPCISRQTAPSMTLTGRCTDFTTEVNHGNTTFNDTVATVTSTLTCPGNQVVKVESFSATGTLSLVGGTLTADLSWTYPS
jgi:hypothetical protein